MAYMLYLAACIFLVHAAAPAVAAETNITHPHPHLDLAPRVWSSTGCSGSTFYYFFYISSHTLCRPHSSPTPPRGSPHRMSCETILPRQCRRALKALCVVGGGVKALRLSTSRTVGVQCRYRMRQNRKGHDRIAHAS